MTDDLARKKSLIARMAGNIAGGICADPNVGTRTDEQREAVAKDSVAIAKRIVELVDELK